MRLVFYLPAITQSWAEVIVAPLIRIAAREADVHVIVPPPWNGTGVHAAMVERLRAQSGATWHLFDDADHPALRTGVDVPAALMRLVRELAADYTICRSADVRTPRAFPGKVAFLMEADYPPLARGALVRLTDAAIFDHGVMPALDEADRHLLTAPLTRIRGELTVQHATGADARARFLAAAGLPDGHPLLAIPLEHDGADNVYMLHSPSPVNAAFVRDIVAALTERWTIALTLHPAQRDDPDAIAKLAALADSRIHIPQSQAGGDLTPGLARHCDAMAFRDSKSLVWAGVFAKPFYRLSRFATGGWLNASRSMSDLTAQASRHADREHMLVWLGWHLANCAFKPDDPGLDLAEMIDRIDRPCNPARWAMGMERRRSDIAAAAAALAAVGG